MVRFEDVDQYQEREEEGNNMMCVICMCDFEEGELLRSLPCNHVYHVECIDPWLRTKKTCAICNTPIDQPPQL